MSYPYGTGQGWNQGQPGYPPQQPGYPGQGGGYPPQPQPGYPGYPPAGGMPMPQPDAYPSGNTPYPAQPGIGFSGVGAAPAYGGAPGAPSPYPAGPPPAQPSYGANYVPPAATYNPPPQPPQQTGYPGAPSQYPNTQYPQTQYPQTAVPGYTAPAAGYSSAQAYQQPAHHQPQGSAPAKSAVASTTKAMAGLSMQAPKYEGTLKPYPSFNAESDGQILRKAMKGFGTDEKAIIDVLGKRTDEQRQQILLMYKTMFGKDLIKDLKGELSGHFEDAIVALMTKSTNYDASELRRAMKGLGTDEDALIEILCTRSNAQIHEIKKSYKTIHKRDLEEDLASETSGHFKRLMISMSVGGRQENQAVDQAKAKQDAQTLYQAGEKKWGTDESKFNQILASQSFPQLRAVFDEYAKISNKTMEQAIKSEMSGDLEQGMLTLVKIARNPPAYFAEKLYKSMKGMGTDDRDLVRLTVTRCEVDMVQIKQEFQRLYQKSLEDFIKGDISGDYKRILLTLIGAHY